VFRLLLIAAAPAVASIPRSASAPTQLSSVASGASGVPTLSQPAQPASLPLLPGTLPLLPADPGIPTLLGLDPVEDLFRARAAAPLRLDPRDPWSSTSASVTVSAVSRHSIVVTSIDTTDPWGKTGTLSAAARNPGVFLDSSDIWGEPVEHRL
jgi:hypothetical protein